MIELARRLAWMAVPGYMADRAVRWNLEAQRRSTDPEPVGEVRAGPFAGLKYPDAISESVVSPQLKRSGSYEETLVPIVVTEFDRPPSEFVDIGAAEGFYAVSGARRGIPTIAYESSSIQRRALRELADANDAAITIRRHCRTVPEIQNGGLLLMDVEGAEAQLLTGGTPRRIAGCTVIVELHEHFVPGVTETLQSAFAGTHESELVTGPPEPGRQGGDPVWAIFRPR